MFDNFSPAAGQPIYLQLYEYLRAAILSGQIKGRLPSTRALADLLGISRNTVLNAYDQLFAEGYLENLQGKGTFVSDVLPEMLLSPSKPVKKPSPSKRVHRLSLRAETVIKAPSMPPPMSSKRTGQAFQTGSPALDVFPYELWGKLVARHAHRLVPDAMMYQDLAGYYPLREAIANHVLIARQVQCKPEQVIIVSGSQAGLYLATCALINPGDRVWIEDPGYPGAHGAMTAAGGWLVPVEVDENGLNVDDGIANADDARLVYTTPSHQFPLGVVMSLRRRLALLDWAKENHAYILEDDYDSEFRFAGRPLAALYGIDTGESVIYVGTFSKVLFPALRLGYLIVPPALVEAFLALRRSMDYHLPVLEQAVVADFIAEGHFTRHIRRMRALYAERRGMLLDALQSLPLELQAPDTGMHLIGWLPNGIDDRIVAQQAAKHHVRTLPLSRFAIEARIRSGLILGYASLDSAEIERGAAGLASALRECGI